MKETIVAGLDLGTTKVVSVIAKHNGTNIDIISFGVAQSEGLNRGLVANIAKTSEAIEQAMKVAINRANIKIKSVKVGVAGEHVRSLRHRNYVAITGKDNEITENDIERLRQDVMTIRIPSDRRILHIIPEEYFIDHQTSCYDPIGMCGTRLEAVNHVVLASIPAIQNIKRSVERAGYLVSDYILQPIASSAAVLEENEKDLGVALIDIGGGTTDIAIYHNKSIKYTKVIGIAGNQITNDIRETLGIITSEAEKLKIEFGYAFQSTAIKEEDIFIKGVGGRGNIRISNSLLTQIIYERMKELFEIVDKELRQSGFKKKLKAGIVLTGGGSLLSGTLDLAQEIIGLPARLGVPLELSGALSNEMISPEFATAVGLVKSIPGLTSQQTFIKGSGRNKNNLKNILIKLKEFFADL